MAEQIRDMFRTQIVCISGKAQHGKDTTANILREELIQRGYKVLVIHHADLLKFMARSMFEWDGQKDENGRHLLQYIGTDIVRKKEPNFWVDFLISVFQIFDGEWDFVIIPDCRFPNEILAYMGAGFYTLHVRVVRENFTSHLTKEQQEHISETALDDTEPHIRLINNGSVDDLRHEIREQVVPVLDLIQT